MGFTTPCEKCFQKALRAGCGSACVPGPGQFPQMARLRNHGKTMQQKVHRGQFEAQAVVEHFWLIARSCKAGVWPLQRHTVVSRTSTLMEIPTRNNPLQRFGLPRRTCCYFLEVVQIWVHFLFPGWLIAQRPIRWRRLFSRSASQRLAHFSICLRKGLELRAPSYNLSQALAHSRKPPSQCTADWRAGWLDGLLTG